MAIKRIITCGCSFADAPTNRNSWPAVLENMRSHIPELCENDVSFLHRGLGSQGNELIQKKTSLALIESLEEYKPEEILVLVMWSGTERKTFYVDNKDFVQECSENWKKNSMSWGLQFSDLKNTYNGLEILPGFKNFYNKNGGWYICNYTNPDSQFVKDFYNLNSTVVGPATTSLENMIMLQNLCKLKNVRLIQSFYRSYVFEDIELNKDHLNLNYLYKQWDFDTIVSTTGMLEYLRPEDKNQKASSNPFYKIYGLGEYKDEYKKYFNSHDDWHPNEVGAKKWLTEVLIPKIVDTIKN